MFNLQIRKIAFILLFIFFAPGLQIGYADDNTSTTGISVRIIGGEKANTDAWPWMAALVYANSSDYYKDQFCGGALIADTWVLTAAHCVYNTETQTWKSASSIDVVLGLNNLANDPGEKFSITRIIGHSQYNPDTYNNDIALLELDHASSIDPLSVFEDKDNDLAGTTATVIGWGDTDASSGYSYPEDLQQVDLPIISNATCSTSYPGAINGGMLCAGYADGGKDSCQGDSGGPLVVDIDGQWHLAGIVSWGEGCALAGYYGVYTRVSNYISFLRQIFPLLDVSSSKLFFGRILPGTGKTKILTLSNEGDDTLTITGVALEDASADSPFTVTSDLCTSEEMDTGDKCTVSIKFLPQSNGSYKNTFHIYSNNYSASDTEVSLSGFGGTSILTFLPAILSGKDRR